MLRFSSCLLALSAAVLLLICLLSSQSSSSSSVGVLAQKEHIKQHHRGGAFYRDVLASEKQFHLDFNLGDPNSTANWFDQPLYPGQSAPTFKQRWFVDYSGWNSAASKKNLAIIYIPGEGPCESSLTGYGRQWAVENGAVLVSLENRWYGKSLPDKLTNKALLMNTLSVDIALSDLSVFIKYFEKEILGFPVGTVTWLAMGGSYSGALSAWMRQSYPDQITASWSSSGVVHPTFDFNEYDGHVSEMLDSKCYQAIKDAYNEFDSLYDDPVTRPRVYQLLQVPTYFTKRDMAFSLADQGAGMVQYGRRTKMCDYLLPEDTQSPLEKYVAMANFFFGAGCFSNCGYSTMCMSNTQYSDQWAGAGYSWFYQTCSQVAWWQIGTPFSLRSEIVSTEYMIQQCRATFTADILPDVYTFNQVRGGYQVFNTTYVVAAQGADDPWSTVGVRVSPRENYPVYIAQCPDCGHCGDLMSPTPTDAPDLQAQRQFINNTLRGWLKL